MENHKETASRKPSEASAATVNPRTDIESGGGGQAVQVVRPGKSEKISLGLRVAALVFSVVAFITMACTQGFDEVHEWRYILAAGILCTVYTSFQVSRQGYYLSTGKSLFEQRTISLVGFYGDQIVAYLLVSSASATAPSIATVRLVEDDLLATHETSSLIAASTSMAFLAFFALAVSAVLSAYKLKN